MASLEMGRVQKAHGFQLFWRTMWARAYPRIIGSMRERSWMFFETILPLMGTVSYVFVYEAIEAPRDYIGFVIVLMGMRNSGFSPSFSAMISPYVLMGMALLVCSMESGVLFNRFGYEGGNFTATLLSPVPRLSILRAKSSM